MKYNILATLLFAIYLLIACTHSGRDSKLVQAETLMQKFPDSALHLLQEIRPEELNSLEDQAYHIANLYLSQRLNDQADSIYQFTEKLAIQE